MTLDSPKLVGGPDSTDENIVGRFAPSPTGDLHFGSLLAAMASYCDVKYRDGQWLLRIDDIDGPRSVPGSADSIRTTLAQYGFEWDGAVQWQSQNINQYRSALETLVNRRLVFACNCSRRSLPSGEIYPGKCRHNIRTHSPDGNDYFVADHALRVRLTGHLMFEDAVQSMQTTQLDRDVGDIIVWRRDNLVAYALACAVDDSQTVSHVVRGADLLGNTSAQVAILKALNLPVPKYAHIPVAVDHNGDKLSKHSKAPMISSQPVVPTLLQAWNFLGQVTLEADSVSDFWTQAVSSWQLCKVPREMRLSL